MKRFLFIIFAILLLLALGVIILIHSAPPYDYPAEAVVSESDSLINQSFDIRTLELEATYDGPAIATLLWRPADSSSDRAVLYLHGYGDYFFQEHLAEWYNDQGFDFYALDLRRYGRSWLRHQRPNYVTSLSEYFEEIDRAIEIIKEEGHRFVLLNGHSTGGLTASIYCKEGARRAAVDALFLNSPFLDFNGNWTLEQAIRSFAWLGEWQPEGVIGGGEPSVYTKSLHRDYFGRWSFNTNWKPTVSFPVYLGWLNAIEEGHQKVSEGLDLDIPILVMHSDESYFGDDYAEAMHQADAVLDVEEIHNRSTLLGAQVTVIAIPKAVHDIFLSDPLVLHRAYGELEDWLNRERRLME